MLKSLFIQNYALIDTLDIRFESGFSVITGETGAGKSIILGAIGLLLGQRADSKSIKKGTGKCIIEALFDLGSYGMEGLFEHNDLEFDGHDCIVRREITSAGKSRAFINDTPVSISLLKELGETLIDVHSQHQNLLLNKENFQLNVIDILAGDKEELQKYQKLYAVYRDAGKVLEKALREAEKSGEEEDYLRFQLEQLENATLQPDEQEELEHEAELLNHAEEIKHTLFQTDALLNDDERGVIGTLKESMNQLSHIGRVYPDAEELSARMESCYIELKDISGELATKAEQTEFNPERMTFVNERLNLIYSLQQKHHVDTIASLLTIEEDYRARLSAIDHSEEHIQTLKAEKEQAFSALKAQAQILTGLRTQAARQTETQMEEKLIPLGIPNVRFKVELTEKENPDESGADKINFLFSANKNGTLQPISQVASGAK